MTKITYHRQQVEESFNTFYNDLLGEPELSKHLFNYQVSENMPNYVNDERLYHMIEFELARDLVLFKLERTEVFSGLALAAGLLAAFHYVFGWIFSIFYPFLMIQFMVLRMFKIDPSKGQPPKKLTKNDRITNADKEAFVNEAKARL